MAMKTVRAKVNGTWHNLTYNSTSGKWEASITAPGATSYHQPGGYYNIEVEATNDAGTTVTASGGEVAGLRLVVKEKIPPVVTITSPANGAYVTNNKQPVTFTVTDETGGSGVDISALVVKQDGTAVTSGIVSTEIENGYQVTYTPAAALADGSHTVTVTCADHDGNSAAGKSTTYKVDTVPPTLNVTAPAPDLMTNQPALTVSGTTNDTTSSPVTVTIQLNGADQGAVTVGSGGAFSKAVTLLEGANTLVIKATDGAGKVSSVTRTVTLDTGVPVIQSASVLPNPADAGSSVILSVVIV